ncbi:MULTISPECIES: YoaK family protein [Rhodococcus]|uniref:YoaK family protein n=1 Tax=Rhodococcus parequi TaxID=3137122 RepID=A0ABW9FGQ4_9NOCA
MVLHYPRGVAVVAVFLSGLAGFVDAMGFITLGGYFVSFMSGNSTKLAVSLGDGLVGTALTGAGIVVLFVIGVMAGSFTGRTAARRHRPAVLVLVTILLALAAVAHLVGVTAVAIALMVLAMGAENSTFEREGEVSISLTYMTGTLVKMGQRLVTALTGGERWGWVRHFLLWSAMVLGAALGALAHRFLGLNALWVAALWAAILAAVLARMPPPLATRR